MSQFKPNQTIQNKNKINQKNSKFALKLTAGIGILLLATTGCISFKQTGQKKEIQTVKSEEVSINQEQNLTELARSITVKIIANNSGGGSGVLIKKNSNTYTVLTNHHVVQDNGINQVITPDDKSHEARLLNIDFPNKDKDVALLEFISTENYQVASLSNLGNTKTGNQVLAAGFPFRDHNTYDREFAWKSGRISLVLPQPFHRGYQVGYINDIEKGMSGGPVLNFDRKLIAINGIHPHPLWGSPYIYENNPSPSDRLRQRFKRSSWGIPVEILAKFAPDIIPELSITQSPDNHIDTTALAEKIDQIAEQISVKIQWQNGNGSGVIIARDGDTYSVLTAEHVASGDRQFTIYTPDDKKYSVDNSKIKTWDNIDLALIQFTSQEDYQVAKLGDYSLDSQDKVIFVTGWQNSFPNNDRRGRKFSVGFNIARGISGEATLNHYSLSEGQGLIYTNVTEKGMSGGAILDTKGRLIGINTATEAIERDEPSRISEEGREKRQLDIGYSLGVPIRTFFRLINKDNTQLNLQIETNSPLQLTPVQQDKIVSESLTLTEPDNNADKVEWLNYGNQLWRALRFKQAQDAFEKAIDIDPSFFEAWYSHGLALKSQGEWQKAISSFQKVVESKPTHDINSNSNSNRILHYEFEIYAHREQAICYQKLLQPYKSLASLNQALDKRPDDFALYNSLGRVFFSLGEYGEAKNAIEKSIKFSGEQNPYPYIQKAEVELSLMTKNEEIIEIYNQAIKAQPNLAVAYALRGMNTDTNYAEAIKYINTAIELNPGNALFYAQRGLIDAKFGNKQEFEQNFEKAIKLEPDNPKIYSLRGKARANLFVALKKKGETIDSENTQQAIIDDYRTAIRLEPESVGRFYSDLSISLANMGSIELSISFYQKAKPYLSNKDIEIRRYDSYVNKMSEYYDMGDREKGDEELRKAIDLANQAILKYPQLAFRFHELNAVAYWVSENSKPENATKNYSLSIESWTKAIESSNGGNAYQYYKRAEVYRFQGNNKLALADINQATKLESDANPNHYNFRGNIYFYSKKYNKAIDNYSKAIEKNPDNPQYYENRFQARSNLGDYDHKFGSLEKLLLDTPRKGSQTRNRPFQNRYFWRFLLLFGKEVNEESAPLFIDSMQSQRLEILNNTILYPDNVEYSKQLAQTYKRLINIYISDTKDYQSKDYQSVFEILNDLATIDPNNSILLESYQLICQFAIKNQDWEQGIIALEKIRKIDPNSHSLIEEYDNFAAMAGSKKNHQYEIFGRQKLIEIQPNNPKNHRNLGEAYFRNQKYEKALEAYTEAIKLNPNDGSYYSLRADAHEKLGNYEQFKLDAQKARQKNTDLASKIWLKVLQLIP